MTNAATTKQDAFISSLLEQRDVDEKLLQQVSKIRGNANAYTVKVASAIINELLKCKPMPKAPAAQVARQEVTDGMYRDPSGVIYKVQYNRAQGDGRRAYAKQLHVDGYGDVHFEYAPGAMRFIKPEWRMTLEQAKEFGALYGTCCVCGRTLTNEVSIEEGIGPVCAGRI